jgi:hypothetical protein
VVVIVLAVAAGGIGILDGEINWARHSVLTAGGPSLASWVAIVCIGAAMLIRSPRRQAAWMWIAVSIGTFIGALLWWSASHLDLLDRHTILWPEQTMFALVGAVLLLLCVGLPIVLLTSSEHQDDLPQMRVVID